MSIFCCPLQSKRQRRKDARPGELLDAALEIFVEKGFAATRVEDVARQAGVSKGTVFLYFASKEELLKAVVRENISGRLSEWEVEFTHYQGSTQDMLRYVMRSWWERIDSTKASGISRLMVCEACNFPELATFYQDEVILPTHNLIKRILQRGVEKGEFRALTETELTYGVYTVLAPMLFLAMTQRCTMGLPIEPQAYLITQVETILFGLMKK